MATEQRYDYSFSVWPSETWAFQRAVYLTFEHMNARLTLTFTPLEFERYRASLAFHGLTLREIERVPYVDPEPVA